MVMASRHDGPFLTAVPRSAPIASVCGRSMGTLQPAASTAQPPSTESRADALPRIAALDDDPAAVASMTAILSQSGFDVVPYTDAVELEMAARATPFSAYVLDWYLGDTTAAPLIEALRRHPLSAGVPIFLLSGNLAVAGVPTDDALARIIGRYHVQYRAKPYSGVKLASDLRLALGDRRG